MHRKSEINIAADLAAERAAAAIRETLVDLGDIHRAEVIAAAQILSNSRMMSLDSALDRLNNSTTFCS